jgi:hypothetical protein
MAPRNRLHDAWLRLDEVKENRANIGVLMGVGAARNLFVDWVTSGCPSYFEPLATAPATVREAMSPLRAFLSTCTAAEIDEFVELVEANR